MKAHTPTTDHVQEKAAQVIKSEETMVELRQQLSCASKELLEAAADKELIRLSRLRDDLCCLTLDAVALEKLDARIEAMLTAKRQLAYVYIDQFELGRAENDYGGRLGLGKI